MSELHDRVKMRPPMEGLVWYGDGLVEHRDCDLIRDLAAALTAVEDHHRALIETCTEFRAAVKSRDVERVAVEAAVLDGLTIGEFALTVPSKEKVGE